VAREPAPASARGRCRGRLGEAGGGTAAREREQRRRRLGKARWHGSQRWRARAGDAAAG